MFPREPFQLSLKWGSEVECGPTSQVCDNARNHYLTAIR
jgi:hypothetical protein